MTAYLRYLKILVVTKLIRSLSGTYVDTTATLGDNLDRTGAAGASPIGPGPTERDPGPGRDSTWDPLNALGPTEPGPTEPKLKPPARVVTAGSYQI